MKTSITTKFSLRAKFKSNSMIELVITNHQTGEEFCHLISFATGNVVEENQEEDLPEVTSEDTSEDEVIDSSEENEEVKEDD